MGTVVVLLAVWGVAQYIEYLGTRTPTRPAGDAADPSQPDATAGQVSARLEVQVLDEKNKEFPVGTPLPRRLMLTMGIPDGQAYSMPFDKVGVWASDVPPGEYLVSLEQEHLGNWRWKLEGKGVKMDDAAGAYRLKIAGREQPLTMKLTLF